MKMLVTGAAGFLGRAFLRHLRQRDVVAIDNLSNPHSFWPPGEWTSISEGYERVEMDLLEALRYLKPEEYSVVYHFAAPVGGREKIEGDPLYNADSLRLDAGLFRWVTGTKTPPTVVYPSSSAVYGTVYQTGVGLPLSEKLFHPADVRWAAPDELYGFTKMAGERLAWAAQTYGVNTLCLRPFSGYGEEQGLDYPVPSIARRAASHEDPLLVWGPGSQRRDFIHVDDIVAGTFARLNHSRGVSGYEAMNLGSGLSNSFDDVARYCAMAAGYRPQIAHVEDKPVGVDSRYADAWEFHRYYHPRVTLIEGLARVVAHYA